MVAAVHSLDAKRASQAPVSIDPAVARLVGDVARPVTAPPIARGLDHFPGFKSGRIAGIVWLTDYMRRGADAVADAVRAYGPVHRVPYFTGEAVSVCDPELAAGIARNTDHVWSAALAWTAFFEGIDVRNFLTTLDFDAHKEARRLLQPAFGPVALGGYMAATRPIFDSTFEKWTARAELSFKREVRALLASVSSRIFLGDESSGPMLDRALSEAWSGPYAIVKNRFLSGTWRRGLRGRRTLTESLRAMIPVRRAQGGTDLFSRLCSEPNNVEWLDDDAMVGLFVGIMFGAFDTTSAGLTSMAYLLAKHPEWQERLRQEALEVGPGPLTVQQAQELEATDRCWKETLRLYPVTGGIPRYALRDVEVAGMRVPAGTYVFGMLGPAQRDADWWTNPTAFNPDRFADGRAEDKKRPGLFMPFGAGAHTCIGSQLATLETKAFWHALLPRCRFRLASDYEPRHTYTPLGMVSGDVRLAIERV